MSQRIQEIKYDHQDRHDEDAKGYKSTDRVKGDPLATTDEEVKNRSQRSEETKCNCPCYFR